MGFWNCGNIFCMDLTNEFSFILKPAEFGVGVFAVHDIKQGTYLRLFREKDAPLVSIDRKVTDVPEVFRLFCLWRGDSMKCPSDLGRMEIGWHLNHSKNPNAQHVDYEYYASRDIKAGEEIVIDYNSLEESEEDKDEYYKN